MVLILHKAGSYIIVFRDVNTTEQSKHKKAVQPDLSKKTQMGIFFVGLSCKLCGISAWKEKPTALLICVNNGTFFLSLWDSEASRQTARTQQYLSDRNHIFPPPCNKPKQHPGAQEAPLRARPCSLLINLTFTDITEIDSWVSGKSQFNLVLSVLQIADTSSDSLTYI